MIDESLDPLIDEEPAGLAGLKDRLAKLAGDSGLLDVGYLIMDSPLGPLLLAATERGLVRVAYQIQDHDRVIAELSQKISPRVLRAPRRLDPVARELDEYFAGQRSEFDLDLDLVLTAGFRQQVLRELPTIAYGSTASYRQIAERAGSPRAFRAVGTACALNPLPIVLPCHRVVPTSGGIGRYAGGPEAKAALLALESR
ncbi:methylated-DNA--[protein]-cysteine S-methyltransferase [Microlunatus parietis]|uniref:Methylated-DNA--protein-cysteine methyltransferase n=1 Tax=Microlunatus parietis TaxID=682979 RepID=A0A7Y9LEL9_9ACTN|nr:methylated-DNA--[protein]-cysteine S-methyltransferase [Microlunatus parietis]NYE74025.1 methylated-DNA-[protein]-cysteine S-methyltransferase [Microlunatus parietis]